ncbi:hypothetical protein EGW08_019487 [Elysia chlorotica]|uniref:Uncharacterized protein n=1 Tax=Elysia chlorotica TaxID=188477 RepID=A0A433SU46_ELYCH|nr:hypothetical protein EGW08_019487 [Elysia chlorotica]
MCQHKPYQCTAVRGMMGKSQSCKAHRRPDRILESNHKDSYETEKPDKKRKKASENKAQGVNGVNVPQDSPGGQKGSPLAPLRNPPPLPGQGSERMQHTTDTQVSFDQAGYTEVKGMKRKQKRVTENNGGGDAAVSDEPARPLPSAPSAEPRPLPSAPSAEPRPLPRGDGLHVSSSQTSALPLHVQYSGLGSQPATGVSRTASVEMTTRAKH